MPIDDSKVLTNKHSFNAVRSLATEESITVAKSIINNVLKDKI